MNEDGFAAAGRRDGVALDQFVDRAAQREGVDTEEAREHARAVLVTLRKAVGEQEFLDITVQLPGEYVTALMR